MASSITDIVKTIVDSESAAIEIPTTDGKVIRLKCIYKESIAPNFFLIFPPKTLPENIDTSKHCPIAVHSSKTPYTLTAKILTVTGDRTLELMAKNTIDPTSLREFFRVDIRIPITATYEPGATEDQNHRWTLKGETLDMSGSGVLAIFPDQPKNKHRISLNITLRHSNISIECTAHVVRSRRLRKGHYRVALHFDEVSPRHRDHIISCCLQEQRLQLRERIQTVD